MYKAKDGGKLIFVSNFTISYFVYDAIKKKKKERKSSVTQ